MLAALTGCLAVTGYVAVAHPAAVRDPSYAYSLVLAAVLTGYLGMALTPPRFTIAYPRTRRLAPLTAFAAATPWIMTPIIAAHHGPDLSRYAWPATLTVILAACTLAGAVGRSRQAAIETGLWAGMISALLRFTTGVPVLLAANPPAPDGPAISDHLGASISMLLLLPVSTVILGTIGGALGNRLGNRLRLRPPEPMARSGGNRMP
jgi:hypothetical protein